jgi:hypothetical protein
VGALSGAARYGGNGGDVDIYPFGPDEPPLCCQVKARASCEGFATLARWLSDADALFLRRDRADPLVVLPWSTWARLVPGMAPGRRRIATAARAEGRPIAQSPAEAPDIGTGNGAPAGAASDAVRLALDELIAAHEPTHGDFADTAAASAI